MDEEPNEEILFSKKDLHKLNTMSYEEKKSIIFNMPVIMATNLYIKFCSRGQLIDLLKEWDILLNSSDDAIKIHGEPKKLKKRYKKIIPALMKGLKKRHQLFFVPLDLRKKYGF